MYPTNFRVGTVARIFAVVVLLAATQSAWSQAKSSFQEPIRADGVSNFGRVSDQLYRGAQPSSVGFNTLHNMGVSIIVNFRDEVDPAGEKREVESLGMKYVGIPWSAFSNPSDAQVVQFLDLVRANPQAKIFVHCQRGADRTGTMIAAYRVVIEHQTPQDAVSEMYKYRYAHFFLPHLQHYITSLPNTLQTNAAYSAYAPAAHPTVATAAAGATATIAGVPLTVQ
jgi:protein tyrosine/serine phosphatase